MNALQDIRDFLKAADAGWLGEMPAGFNRSSFVQALRAATQGDEKTLRAQVIEECVTRIKQGDYGNCERDTASRTVNNVTDQIVSDLRSLK